MYCSLLKKKSGVLDYEVYKILTPTYLVHNNWKSKEWNKTCCKNSSCQSNSSGQQRTIKCFWYVLASLTQWPTHKQIVPLIIQVAHYE